MMGMSWLIFFTFFMAEKDLYANYNDSNVDVDIVKEDV